MEQKRSLDAFLDFLDYVAKKGLMNPTTANARKVAAAAILSVLDDDEKKDVTHVDLGHAMMRFQNLQGKNFTPDSLKTYQSRVRSALGDFTRYLENPLAFRPALQPRERRASQSKGSEENNAEGANDGTITEAAKNAAGPMASSILPIPIRVDLTVFIQGLPFNLTSSEARKISAVVMAMSMPD